MAAAEDVSVDAAVATVLAELQRRFHIKEDQNNTEGFLFSLRMTWFHFTGFG